MVDRIATYRWQLVPPGGFADAAEAVPDLAALGVSHLYLSPIAEAVPGSTHGYDVTDPTRIREELGGEAGFRALVDTCREHVLGVLVDIVPNHLAAHPANPFWWDVLRLGRASRWACLFDIDWDPPKRQLHETVLVPVLGDHYGRELEAGRITLERGDRPGRVVVARYFEHELPLSPGTTAGLLGAAATRSGDVELGVAARLLARVDAEPLDDLEARDIDLAAADTLALGRLGDPGVAAALDAVLAEVHGDPDRLDALLDAQHHRLARWQVASAELVYRRFFDVDTLVGTRADDEVALAVLLELPVRLVREGLVDGLRIDHVDGLRDPATFLGRLRGEVGDEPWVLVEKILRADERLPASWPVDGTTGYEVADVLGGWLTDPAGGEAITAGWRERTGVTTTFEEVADAGRRLVLDTSLAADVDRVTDGLVRVCEGRRRHRDHPRADLRTAVVELAAQVGTYRSYVAPDGAGGRVLASEEDVALVERAVERARDARPDLDPELLDLVGGVLVGRFAGADEADVALRFQQLTGPVAAKGEEDTALYRYLPLPHRCEVGSEPSRPWLPASAVHAVAAAGEGRNGLTSLTTHDTKRSADVRARLAAATTVPDQLLGAFDAWAKAAGAGDGAGVHPADAWLAFHTLLGAWPLDAERADTVLRKSLREAKERTTWTEADADYEDAVVALAVRTLDDAGVARPVVELVDALAPAAEHAALAQLLLQLLFTGVPDLYRGSEDWDLSLVDPDNRRPIDPAARHAAIEEGRPRAALIVAALRARRAHGPDLGPWTPLAVEGPDADRVVAATRGAEHDLVVAAARLGPGARTAADARVSLPPGRWRFLYGGDGEPGGTELDLAALPRPIVLLEARR